MDVQSCIDVYCQLSKNVFRDENIFGKIGRLSGRVVKATRGRPWFDASKLEKEVKAIVQKRLDDADAVLAEGKRPKDSSSKGPAKCFVVATRAGSTTPVLLRSYQAAEESYHLTIWQTCRATSAAPLFFAPITVGTSPPVEFVDGAMGNNNPVNFVVSEARYLWPSSPFAIILSLGTGTPDMKSVGTKAFDVMAACVTLATNAETTAQQFRENQPHMVQKSKYFRFNVEQGLQNVGIEEWKALGTIVEPATMNYLDKVKVEIATCAAILRDPESAFLNPTSDSGAIYDVELIASNAFTGRKEILERMEKCLLNTPGDSDSLRIVTLYGLGGVGKTQIAVKYAGLFRHRYKYVFWVDARNRTTVKDSLVRVAELLAIERKSFTASSSSWSMIKIIPKLIAEQGKWLIIFDNADFLNEVNISNYLPMREVRGNIIITSRDPSSARLAVGGEAIEVGELPENDAIDLLLNCSCKPKDDEQRKFASEIVEELGYLPLAIDQAGCYILEDNQTLPQYLNRYQHHQKKLLNFEPKEALMSYRYTVFTTWEISFRYLEQHSPIAAKLLTFFAFFDNTYISIDVIKNGCRTQRRWGPGGSLIEARLNDSTVPQWLTHLLHPHGVFDDYEFEAQVQKIRAFSLLQQNPDTRSLSIHSLVHEWSRLRLDKEYQSQVLRDVVGFFCHATPLGDIDDAVAEIEDDLALINNYYVTARLWVTGQPRNIYESHVTEVIRADMSNNLLSVADMNSILLAEYVFLLLRSPLHSTSFTATRAFFDYRKNLFKQVTNMTTVDEEYFTALETLSKTRCFVDGSIFYRSVEQIPKILDKALSIQELIETKLVQDSLTSLLRSEYSIGCAGTPSLLSTFRNSGIQGTIQAGLKHFQKDSTGQEHDEHNRQKEHRRTKFQKLLGFQLGKLKDEDHNTWAESAEGACGEILKGHERGCIHKDPRINAVYGEAIMELAVLRYFYDRERGVKTLECWSSRGEGDALDLVEKFTDGRKRLWLKMARHGMFGDVVM